MLAAPAIVRAGNLMPVKALRLTGHDAMMELLALRIADTERTFIQGMNESLYGSGVGWVRYQAYEVLNIAMEDVYGATEYQIRPWVSSVQIDAR